MVLNNQDHIIKDDWVLCPRKDDGNHAMNYNLDGTPAPDTPISSGSVKGEAGRRILAICPEWKQRNHIATDLTTLRLFKEEEHLLLNKNLIEQRWKQCGNQFKVFEQSLMRLKLCLLFLQTLEMTPIGFNQFIVINKKQHYETFN